MEEFDWEVSEGEKKTLTVFLYEGFSGALSRNRDLLHRARRRGALDYVAWITRNIVELRVWVEYCAQSQEHSDEFYQDAFRDLHDLHKSIGGFDAPAFEVLQKSRAFIGNKKPAHKFKKVGEAAKEVGLTQMFSQNNKILSKFAHPTAMYVLGGLNKDLRPDEIRKHFVETGTNIANEAIAKLEQSLLGSAYRKYRPALTEVRESQAKMRAGSKR